MRPRTSNSESKPGLRPVFSAEVVVSFDQALEVATCDCKREGQFPALFFFEIKMFEEESCFPRKLLLSQ